MDRPQLTMTDTWHGRAREAAILTIPEGEERAGTWHGEIRARLLDEASGDWWFEVGYNVGAGMNFIGTFPASWVRRPELDDMAGIVPRDVLERMEREGCD